MFSIQDLCLIGAGSDRPVDILAGTGANWAIPGSSLPAHRKQQTQCCFAVLIPPMARRIKEGSPDCALVVGSIVRTLCAASAYGPPQNQIVPGLCLGSERHSTALLRRFSPGAWPVFSLPGIAIHQQSVIYGIFYTELRFSRAGCWSIWA